MNINYEFLCLRKFSKDIMNFDEFVDSDSDDNSISRPMLYWDEMEPGEARKFLKEDPQANEKYL